MIVDPTLISTAIPLGLGAIIGYSAGWLCRKVIKIAIIVAGLILVFLTYLEYNKTISVNWNVVNNQTESILHIISVKLLHAVNIIQTDLNNHASAFPILGVAEFGFIRG